MEISVIQKLVDAGYQAVIAGGWVRDKIMGVESNDIDIATNATPDQVEALFEKTIPVGKSFGVVNVIEDSIEYEVATFRKDSAESDGRRPDSVTFGTMEEDSKRRDFTINGMFYNPIKDEIIDYVGGQKDIKDGIIRFIGNPLDRINEDRLRMLRAVRFAIKFDFIIETDFISKHGHKIFDISYERIRDELVKMIMIGKPRKMIDALKVFNLKIIPDVMCLSNTEQDPIWHPEGATVAKYATENAQETIHDDDLGIVIKREKIKPFNPEKLDPKNKDHFNPEKYKIYNGSALEHTIRVMENLVGESLELQLAGMFHDVGKVTTSIFDKGRIKSPGHAKEGARIVREALRKLKFSNKTIEYVGELVYNHMKIIDFEKMRKSKQIIFMNRPDFQDLRKLHIADKKGGNGNLKNIEYLDSIEIVKKEDPIITGKDIIDAGITDGRTIGRIKSELYHLQLEGMDKDGLKVALLEKAIGGFLKKQSRCYL